MNNQARIRSIRTAKTMDSSITGFPIFDLSGLVINSNIAFDLPSNLRLGHVAEKAVSNLLHSSSNYRLIDENIQVLDGKTTIGELDFIVQHIGSKQFTHVELAYKFYLLDPSISTSEINNWIGPNRNDSLIEKLEKLKQKQFPLLFTPFAQKQLAELPVQNIKQALCLLASLYVPLDYNKSLAPGYEKCIRGHYLNYDSFLKNHTKEAEYHLPDKKQWGIDPSNNENWNSRIELETGIQNRINEKQSILCWKKMNGHFSEFFITWW